jgi:hypothetical protein
MKEAAIAVHEADVGAHNQFAMKSIRRQVDLQVPVGSGPTASPVDFGSTRIETKR